MVHFKLILIWFGLINKILLKYGLIIIHLLIIINISNKVLWYCKLKVLLYNYNVNVKCLKINKLISIISKIHVNYQINYHYQITLIILI
jgi:hypothetical protein